MPSEVDIRPMVETNSAVPMDQLRVARSLEELRLSNADRGIIFVFAAWSGPTVMAFQRFTRVMKSMDTRSLDVVVLDTDCLTQVSAAQPFNLVPKLRVWERQPSGKLRFVEGGRSHHGPDARL